MIWRRILPGTQEAARLESNGWPDVFLTSVVLHHDGQTLLVTLLPQHRLAALGEARERQSVGDVVAHQLTPDGSEGGEVLVRQVLLHQDPGGDEQRVWERSSEASVSRSSDTWNHEVNLAASHWLSSHYTDFIQDYEFHEKLIKFDL